MKFFKCLSFRSQLRKKSGQRRLLLNSCYAFVLFLVLGCQVWGPKSDETFVEKMNGENKAPPAVMTGSPGVLITGDQPRRKISGTVFCGDGVSRFPANAAKVIFFEGSAKIAELSTASNGSFSASEYFKRGVEYTVQATAVCGFKSQVFRIEGAKLENYQITIP